LKLNPRKEIMDFANAVIKAQSHEIEIMKKLMSDEGGDMNHGGMGH
jgi:uncharacterized protein (DUF305 family)